MRGGAAAVRLLRAQPPGVQPALQRAGAARRRPAGRHAGAGARVPGEAAARRRVRPRARGLRDLRRARAPGRLLAERRRSGVRRLRGGLVPARRPRRTRSSSTRWPGRSPRRPRRPRRPCRRRTGRWPRRWSTTPTSGSGGCRDTSAAGDYDSRAGRHRHKARLRLRRGLARHARPARRQGRERGGDDPRARRGAGARRASRSPPRPASRTCARGARSRRGSTTQVDEALARLEEQAGKRLGDSERPAARVGALGRPRVDAGDDGHGAQPRPERRVGGGARRA